MRCSRRREEGGTFWLRFRLLTSVLLADTKQILLSSDQQPTFDRHRRCNHLLTHVVLSQKLKFTTLDFTNERRAILPHGV